MYVFSPFGMSRDKSVGIVTRLRAGRSGVRRQASARDFFFSKTFRAAEGPTQSIQWVSAFLFEGKATGAWSLPLVSVCYQGEEWMELHLYSPYMPWWHGEGQLCLYRLFSFWCLQIPTVCCQKDWRAKCRNFITNRWSFTSLDILPHWPHDYYHILYVRT